MPVIYKDGRGGRLTRKKFHKRKIGRVLNWRGLDAAGPGLRWDSELPL
jgi:hypothetical protein